MASYERQKRAARQAVTQARLQEAHRIGGISRAEYDIRSGNLFDGCLTNRLYGAGSIGPAAIGVAAIGNQHYAPGSVGPIAIGPGAVGNQHYAPGSVGPAAIGNAAVGNVHIAPGAVGPVSIGNGAVGNQHYAPGSVGPAAIGTGAVGKAAIAPAAVGRSEIATGGIYNEHFSTGCVGPAAIGVSAVGAAAIAPGAVGFSELNSETSNPIRTYVGLRSISGSGINHDCASSDHTHSSTPFVAYGRAERMRVLSERTRLRAWRGRVREAVEDPDSLAELLELLIDNNLNALKLQLDYAEVSREEIEEWLDAGGERAEDYRERNMMDGHSRRHPLPARERLGLTRPNRRGD